jgi:uncharacterized protein YecE (DUF72 family)
LTARTPPGFTFNVKAFSLFTHHPTPVAALPVDLRPAAEKTGKDRVYFQDLRPAVADEAWGRFSAALEPLRSAGKLGAMAEPALAAYGRSVTIQAIGLTLVVTGLFR